ncbi:unnamed protein product [Rangifer tarandus platyrhynchus]
MPAVQSDLRNARKLDRAAEEGLILELLHKPRQLNTRPSSSPCGAAKNGQERRAHLPPPRLRRPEAGDRRKGGFASGLLPCDEKVRSLHSPPHPAPPAPRCSPPQRSPPPKHPAPPAPLSLP